jgi:hypothetical protein
MEYEFYKKTRKDSVNRLSLDANTDGSFTVTSNQPGVDPIMFQSQNDGCILCRESVAMQRQYKHVIYLNGATFYKQY